MSLRQDPAGTSPRKCYPATLPKLRPRIDGRLLESLPPDCEAHGPLQSRCLHSVESPSFLPSVVKWQKASYRGVTIAEDQRQQMAMPTKEAALHLRSSWVRLHLSVTRCSSSDVHGGSSFTFERASLC